MAPRVGRWLPPPKGPSLIFRTNPFNYGGPSQISRRETAQASTPPAPARRPIPGRSSCPTAPLSPSHSDPWLVGAQFDRSDIHDADVLWVARLAEAQTRQGPPPLPSL